MDFNKEKKNDVAKVQEKIDEAHKELEGILEQKNDSDIKLIKKFETLEEIKTKTKLLRENVIITEKKIDCFKDRKQNSFFLYKRFLHNQLQELKGNIRVFWRVRPPLKDMDSTKDLVFDKGIGELMQFPDSKSIEINAEIEDGTSIRNKKKSNNAITSQLFKFDAVFSEGSNQYEVFKEVSDLVISALDGYKVCIFAYGQTGSGKTYTMEGNYESKDQKGIIPRAVDILFENIHNYKANGWDLTVKVNFQEIYLDEIRDLLLPSNSMRHLNKYNKYEPTIVEVEQAEDVYKLLHKSRENRMNAETQWNTHSSRSHSLFQLQIQGHHPRIKGGINIDGALNLIDLAGSERVLKSKAEGDRLKEALSINKSLSSLGHVINALANKEKHIPYRDSKLTYILKDHIGSESAKMLMIVNISPLASHLIESVNSLRFASKVNSCILNKKS